MVSTDPQFGQATSGLVASSDEATTALHIHVAALSAINDGTNEHFMNLVVSNTRRSKFRADCDDVVKICEP